MGTVRTLKIELLRSGPEHNQLLSPLTPYVALAGAAGPQTVHFPFEHRQLVARLARLRYVEGGRAIAHAQREDELRETGEALGRVLGMVPALQCAADAAARDEGQLLHLRLSLSALELGMVPFEAAIAPAGFPGSGAPLLLRTPAILTREVRRNQPMDVHWNRPPRLLFAFAAPGGLPDVPAQEHLNALRRAIGPFVKIGEDEDERIAEVKRLVTVLPHASLSAIGDACREGEYTHVHVLAHGVPFEEAGVRRYGLALAPARGRGGMDVVDGERLALALRGRDAPGRRRRPPTVVTLATCDSGTVDSVLAPGGSIAHELHAQGIPWVVASQFPLWMRSSVIATEVLYRGLLAGDDPRWLLHDLRRRLRTDVPDTHDWASLVAYAVSPWDFDAQIAAFRDRQVRARLEVYFARMDALVAKAEDLASQAQEIGEHAAAIRALHEAWMRELDGRAPAETRAERLGMAAASEKRIAIAYARAGRSEVATSAYERSAALYEQAVRIEASNHWVATQFLSVRAISTLRSDGNFDHISEMYRDWWVATRQVALWQLGGTAGTDRAWALGTLAELELLGTVYDAAERGSAGAADRVSAYCRGIVEATHPDSFPVASTRRQFQRYKDFWENERWVQLAQAALDALSQASAG